MVDVESLELQIKGNASGATKSINALIKTLEKLEKATAGGCGLSAISNEMQKLQQYSSGMSTATKEMQKVSLGLAQVAKEMQKFGNVTSAMQKASQAMNRYKTSSAGVSSSNQASAKSFSALAAKITAVAYTMKKGAQLVGSWINESNEYVENLNLFTVSMGEYAREAQKYAETVGEALGIDPSTWMRSQGVFMTLATGFGVAGDRAATMSQQLTQLGYDLSSFFNISVEEAMDKLKSGFSGELEPLRNLGYDLSKAKLEAIALSLGIDKTYDSMTQAEKSQLRYYAIMTQVTTAQGDMARTLEAPANQLRILTAQVQQAARALGNIFIPVLNAILPYVIAAVKVIRLLANAIASLVGFTMSEVDYSGLSNVSAGAGAASEELDKASGSAAKLKKTLLGIDELNVMPDASSGGGAGVGGGGGEFDFELPTYDFIGDAVSGRVNEIVEKMKDWLGLTGEIKSWSDLFNTNLGQILILIGEIGAGLLLWKLSTGLLDGIKALQELKSAGLSAPLTIMVGVTLMITGFTIEFTGVVDAIKNGLDGLNFVEIVAGGLLGTGGAAVLGSALANWITTAFAGSAIDLAITQAGINLGVGTAGAAGAAILGAFAGIIAGIPAFFVGIYDAIKNGIDWLSALLIPAGSTAAAAGIGAIVGMLGGPIGAGVGALIGVAVGLVTDGIIYLVQKVIIPNWTSIVEWLSNTWAKVVAVAGKMWDGISKLAAACWNAIVAYFSPAIEWFSKLFSSVWQTISDIFYNIGVIASGCWQVIQVAWGLASAWFNDHFIEPARTLFSNLWNGLVEGAKSAWAGVKAVFGPLASYFKTTFQNAWAGVVKVFSTAGTIFVNIKDGITAAFKTIVNGLISGLNKVVSVPFNAINNALTTIKNIKILGLTPFSNLRTISVPSIPYLAEGGVVNSGQLFVANEAGPELVANAGRKTAVMNNDQIVDSVSRGVYQAVVSAMGSTGGDKVVEAKVNDKVLFEVLVSRARQETMRTGYNPLLGGV